MCGLVGIAAQSAPTDRGWLSVGRDTMAHRGPDDAGEWWSADGRVGLAHRRLSILDLSPAGHQPMTTCDGELTIVFNGEIYNYPELRAELVALGRRFRSNCDTEVILEAYCQWGSECLSRFNGMFAFALFDARKQQMFLARDRAGEKPLFLYHASGELRFASELKALMTDRRLPRRISPEALDSYLAQGFVAGDLCILQGFAKLPPAHAMTFCLRSGQTRTWRYWRLPDTAPEAAAAHMAPAHVGELLAELEELLQDSVRRQLAADVPIGILLSGGVDSSLVTAMAARVMPKVKTFTIGFPGHGALDETGHARLIAKHFGTDHAELIAEPATADLLPQLARQFDEPMVDSSMLPTFLVSRLVHQHCTVALSGDGGDELFGGYAHYSRLLWMHSRLRHIPLPLRRILALGAGKLLPVGMRGRESLLNLATDLCNGLPLFSRVFDAATRRSLMADDRRPTPADALIRAAVPLNSDPLLRATSMDFQNFLAEDILVKVDRASMLNSLEIRAPLLDVRLIEFAFGRVPSRLKATQHEKKILLKRLTERLLPPEFDRQRKQGFSIPLAEWLKAGPFRDLFWSVLADPQCLFDRRTVQALMKGQDMGRSNSERLFALVQFELWRREYAVES